VHPLIMKRLRLFIPNNPLFIDKNGVIFYEWVAIYDTHWHLSCCIKKTITPSGGRKLKLSAAYYGETSIL
jgi:hypothetical protein